MTAKKTAASSSPEVRERAVRLVPEGGREHPTQWAAITSVIVDEGDHGFERRSSSAWAKYADALRRVSFA